MWLVFSKESIRPVPILTSATMFIYVAHGSLVANPKIWEIVNNVLPTNRFGELTGYFAIPILAILALIIIHWILRKIAPQTMNIICGR